MMNFCFTYSLLQSSSLQNTVVNYHVLFFLKASSLVPEHDVHIVRLLTKADILHILTPL